MLSRRVGWAARATCRVFGNASGCGQATAEEPLWIRACVLSPPKVTKQGVMMDAAPQRHCWLRGLSSRATEAESSCAGSVDLIKTLSVGHLFARDDAPGRVSLPAPGRGGDAWGLLDCSGSADFPSIF